MPLLFNETRHGIDRQYEAARAMADVKKSEQLYKEVRAAYDSEKYKTLGKGKAMELFLQKTELFINPYDIFADMIYDENTPTKIRRDTFFDFHKKSMEARQLQNEGAIEAFPDFGHTMPDWERLLKLGICGIIAEAEVLASGANEEKRAFYEGICAAYLGISKFAQRLSLASHLTAVGEGCEGVTVLYPDATQKCPANLEFAAKNLWAISTSAPQTLAEAMQLYFVYYAAQQIADGAVLRSLGSIDVLLYPFYEHDIREGILKEADARELIRYFLFKWTSMHVEANIPFDLGLEITPLTRIILEEYIALDVHDPKIHFIVKDDTPRELISTVLDAIRCGKSSFVFINDKTVRAALSKIGMSEYDAAHYTLIGCYEPSSIGRELPCTVGGKISLPRAINETLEALYSGEKIDTVSYDGLYAAILENLHRYVRVTANEIRSVEEKYPCFMQAPTLSATYTDCMASGTDIYAGGARYNNSSINLIGVATYADSLAAIRTLVYEKGVITLGEMYSAMKNGFENSGELLTMIRKECAKYGTGDPLADNTVKDTVLALATTMRATPNGRGGIFRPALFSIDWIWRLGKRLGGTPDGRAAGAPLSKNLCAAAGMDTKGVTGLIRSALVFDHTEFPNGSVLDLCLHPTAVSGDDGLCAMRGLVDVYFAGGGFAVQFNVVSASTLRAAQKEPEKYKNLQIRLCGWNVFFTELDRAAQNHLIESIDKNDE